MAPSRQLSAYRYQLQVRRMKSQELALLVHLDQEAVA
jgi:hypothetical protein